MTGTDGYSEADVTHYCNDCEQPLVVEYITRREQTDLIITDAPIVCGDCGGTNTTEYNRETEGSK